MRQFCQLSSALAHCHSLNIYHRDLKPSNILLTATGEIRLADFGFSLIQAWTDVPFSKDFPGSPAYAAPELFKGLPYHPNQVDVWALGVILFELFTGNLPFNGTTPKELKGAVLLGSTGLSLLCSHSHDAAAAATTTPTAATTNTTSTAATEFCWKFGIVNIGKALTMMLHPVPSKRPNMAQVSRVAHAIQQHLTQQQQQQQQKPKTPSTPSTKSFNLTATPSTPSTPSTQLSLRELISLTSSYFKLDLDGLARAWYKSPFGPIGGVLNALLCQLRLEKKELIEKNISSLSAPVSSTPMLRFQEKHLLNKEQTNSALPKTPDQVRQIKDLFSQVL